MNWISVKEKMPKESESVLLLQDDGLNSMEVGSNFLGKFYNSYDLEIENVTHWQPLPTPP